MPNDFDYENDDITLKVFRRLKLRYGILDSMSDDAKIVSGKLCQTDSTSFSTIMNSVKNLFKTNEYINKQSNHSKHKRQENISTDKRRLYKLVTTDLFVEKALSYLNRKARKYERYSALLFIFIISLFVLAIGCAFYSIHNTDFGNFDKKDIAVMWAQISIVFIKNFTFYGLIIIVMSFLYRMIRSLYDQAERIKDRRHALRQGRLYVHLKGGEVDIEEMKEAFNWNTTQPNAFSDFNPDAQAPFGALLKEAFTTIREGVKSIKS